MNKKLMTLGLMGMFAIALVAAVYSVNSFTITTDVYEPFANIEHVVLGDGSTLTTETCNDAGLNWQTVADQSELDVGGLFAGEARKLCVRFDNLGEAPVDYTFSAGSENCLDDFTGESIEGEIAGLETQRIVGIGVTIADDAAPVDDCVINVELGRGHASTN